MTESERIFTVTHNGKARVLRNCTTVAKSYILRADQSTTLDTAWASQKCWFMPGSVVIITDDRGNSKTFIKE